MPYLNPARSGTRDQEDPELSVHLQFHYRERNPHKTEELGTICATMVADSADVCTIWGVQFCESNWFVFCATPHFAGSAQNSSNSTSVPFHETNIRRYYGSCYKSLVVEDLPSG